MMNSIKILLILLCAQYTFAQSPIELKQDAPHHKDWNFGLYGGYLVGGAIEESVQLGMAAEYSFAPKFAFELELSTEYRTKDHRIFGGWIRKELNLDFSISPKIYFNKKQKWYGKGGIFFNRTLLHNNIEDIGNYSEENNYRYGIQLGIGRTWDMNNNRKIKLEPTFRYRKIEGLSAGLKLGLSF